VFEKLGLVDETRGWIFGRPEKTQQRLAVNMIRSNLIPALKEWGPLISRLNDENRAETKFYTNDKHWPVDVAEGDMSLWLDGRNTVAGSSQIISTSSVDIHDCSSCGKQDANLQKCSKCGTTRYCDAVW
jgi:hypothetical protein